MRRSMLAVLVLAQVGCAARDRPPAYTQEEVKAQKPWPCRVLDRSSGRTSPGLNPSSGGNAVGAAATLAAVAVAVVGLEAACFVVRVPRLFEARPRPQTA